MKAPGSNLGIFAVLVLMLPLMVFGSEGGKLELVNGAGPQHIFSGLPQTIRLFWRNAGEMTVEMDLRWRLYQATSSTAAFLREERWKRLEVLSGQTVVETAELTVPAVSAETRFLVQWLNRLNKVLGTTELVAYPPDLISGMKRIYGDEPPGLYDPTGQLRALFGGAGLRFVDLEITGLKDYSGKLIILGPFEKCTQEAGVSRAQVAELAKSGAGIVWLQAPAEPKAGLKPSFYVLPLGKGAVTVVQHEMLKDLPQNPAAQTKLIQLCELAAHSIPNDSLP